MTAHPKKSESIEGLLEELQLAAYIAGSLGESMHESDQVFLETAKSIEALYNQRTGQADIDARLDEAQRAFKLELDKRNLGSFADSQAERIQELKRTRAGINKKEEV